MEDESWQQDFGSTRTATTVRMGVFAKRKMKPFHEHHQQKQRVIQVIDQDTIETQKQRTFSGKANGSRKSCSYYCVRSTFAHI